MIARYLAPENILLPGIFNFPVFILSSCSYASVLIDFSKILGFQVLPERRYRTP
jgi:hypothetical protein